METMERSRVRQTRWFLSTRSIGTRRLSLVCGVAAAGFGFVDTAYTHGNPYVTWTQLGLVCGLYFICAWALIRVIAWIVAGFIADLRAR
jgi:hypothetical protein